MPTKTVDPLNQISGNPRPDAMLRPPGLCCLLRVRLSPGKFRRNDGMHVPFPAGRFCRQYQEHAADAQNDAGHAGDERFWITGTATK